MKEKAEWEGPREKHSMDSGGQLGSLKEGRVAKDGMYSRAHCARPLSAIRLVIRTSFILLGGITLTTKKEDKFFVYEWTVEDVSCVILMTR